MFFNTSRALLVPFSAPKRPKSQTSECVCYQGGYSIVEGQQQLFRRAFRKSPNPNAPPPMKTAESEPKSKRFSPWVPTKTAGSLPGGAYPLGQNYHGGLRKLRRTAIVPPYPLGVGLRSSGPSCMVTRTQNQSPERSMRYRVKMLVPLKSLNTA